MRHMKTGGLDIATGRKTRRGRIITQWVRTGHPLTGAALILIPPMPVREPLVIEWERISSKHRRGKVNGYAICDLIRHEDKWLLRDGGGRTVVGTVREGERVAQHRFDKRQESYGER